MYPRFSTRTLFLSLTVVAGLSTACDESAVEGSHAPEDDRANGQRCFEPSFSHASANRWWREFSYTGNVDAAELELESGETYAFREHWGKWAHGDSVSTPAGTRMRLLAYHPNGSVGRSGWFRYLQDEPVFDCGAGGAGDGGAGDDGGGGGDDDGDATIVNPGDDLNAIINAASPGDVILVNGGEYGPLEVRGRNFSSGNPVVVRRRSGTVTITGHSLSSGYALKLENSSYLAFDGLVFRRGVEGLGVKSSNHIIFRDCRVEDTGQAGVKIFDDSAHIDFIGGSVKNTGRRSGYARYGEGFYVGSPPNAQWYPDRTHHVWIEGVEISNTGYGEAVNYKNHVTDSTLRGCDIHDISPTHPTNAQANQAAISIESFVEDNLGRAQNIWIEDNTVSDIEGGRSGYQRGIMFWGSGATVVGNTVTHCGDDGIKGSAWHDSGFDTQYFDNSVSGCSPSISVSSQVGTARDPGANPLRPQGWYSR